MRALSVRVRANAPRGVAIVASAPAPGVPRYSSVLAILAASMKTLV
jgi:hypothetical protein